MKMVKMIRKIKWVLMNAMKDISAYFRYVEKIDAITIIAFNNIHYCTGQTNGTVNVSKIW